MVQYSDSTVYFSRIGDRHLRYPGKLRRSHTSYFPNQLNSIAFVACWYEGYITWLKLS